ncbi:hypothetical protein [Pseudomonas viridiflava]|uniref:hypothetical protein n=1 Tax=Pseudomonas viridiflava TaxID=33069 RepID=UPI000F0520D8|nr:hypothetical protein [Pseudomonas viridiflava]
MATLECIDRSGPVLIDPCQYDLDSWVILKPVPGVQPIELSGQEAKTFYQWVGKFWRTEFQKDLQGIATHVTHGDLLTTWIPLVTLREDMCCRSTPREDNDLCELLDKLRLLTREWRAAGVDTVCISGCKDAPIIQLEGGHEQQF